MPSTLPPSTTGILGPPVDDSSSADPSTKPKYVVSSSGHAAHPDDILASCRALREHVTKLQAEAEAELRALEERIRARELAEKRRVAPGWLDSDMHLLEPERKETPAAVTTGAPPFSDGMQAVEGGSGGGTAAQSQFHGSSGFEQDGHGRGGASEMAVPDEGVELDRAFGALAFRPKPQ